MKLSILMCTLPEPFRDGNFLKDISENITRQIQGRSVQLLYLGDNKSMTVGEKRNHLMNMAKGKRIAFVDDDDQISDDYVDRLLEYCELDFDCVGIGVKFTKDGQNPSDYDYSYKKNINTRVNGNRVYGRMPNHLCLWKREIAMRCKFPNKNIGEDHAWAEEQLLKGYSFFKTEDIIYHYDFRPENTQTRNSR
ncbi:MAG: glycosyltransferase [Candidatus Neomarinimicrobiota bacterium]